MVRSLNERGAGRAAEAGLQVDARAPLQQFPHHRQVAVDCGFLQQGYGCRPTGNSFSVCGIPPKFSHFWQKADKGGIISRHPSSEPLALTSLALSVRYSSLCHGLHRHGPCVWHGGRWLSEPFEADCPSCGPHHTRLCPVPPTLAYSLRSWSTSVRVTRPSSFPSSETTGSRPAPYVGSRQAVGRR